MRRLRFFFSEAVSSLFTNAGTSFVATATMLVTLVMVGGLAVFLLLPVFGGSRHTAQAAGTIKVYLSDTATSDDVNALKTSLQRMSDVSSVDFVSKADALKKAKKMFANDGSVFANVPGNPFPASLEARLKDPSAASVDRVAGAMRGQPGVDTVVGDNADQKRALHVLKVISVGSVVMMICFIIAAIMLVANTVRLSISSRRREIEVMKLVGASNSFVRLPFMIEGFLCGLVASVGAALIILGVSRWTEPLYRSIKVSSYFSGHAWTVSGLVILGGIVLGSLASGITIRRYIKI